MDSRKILKTVLFTPGPKGLWGLPTLMEGPPGSAKSSIIEQVAESNGLHCEVVIASVREPADFLGLPIPNGDCVSYMPTSWAYRASKAGRAVGFLDELNTAPEAVQAALLRVVLDRCVGDLQLPKGVRILAAQNRVEEAAGGHDLSMPLANRFVHLAWEAPDVDSWTDWVLSSSDSNDPRSTSVTAEQEEMRVMGVWEALFAKARGLVTGFIRKRPDLLHQQPKTSEPSASKAWPSRRTWEMSMRVLAGSEVHGLSPEDQETLLAGCIGTGASAELLHFLTENDLPDPALLLDGKVPWKPDARLDRTLAILSSCAALVYPKTAERRMERAERLWQMMTAQAKEAADIVIPGARVLVKGQLSAMDAAKACMMKLQPVFAAAGLLA